MTRFVDVVDVDCFVIAEKMAADGGRLKIGDLQKVKNAVWGARTKWKDLGEALGMDPTKLDAIAIKQHHDPGNCLRDMLSDWLRGAGGPARVWSTITAALRANTVDLGTIAEEIEKEYKLAPNRASAPASSTGISRSAAPTMKLLTKWKVIATVSAKWRPLADVLEIDHNVTAGIHERNHGDPELACREILTKWLNGEGSTVSWDELIDCIESVGFSNFAGDLKAKLDP